MDFRTILLTLVIAGVPVAIGRSVPTQAQPLSHKDAASLQTAQGGAFPNTINGRPLEDAPVPGIRDSRVAPVDRAGTETSASQASGPVGSTPFSGTPESERATAGSQLRTEPNASGSNVTPRVTK